MHLPLRTILLFPMTAGARRIPPEKTTCPLRCFQLSWPITGWNYPRRNKDISHSTVNLYIVPDNLISAHSSRNLEFSHLTYVFSISNAHGFPQPQQIKSLFSLPEPHQEDLGFSPPHSASKSLDSMWGNHSDVTFIHFQGNRTKTKNKLSREPNHNTGYIISDNLIYKKYCLWCVVLYWTLL